MVFSLFIALAVEKMPRVIKEVFPCSVTLGSLSQLRGLNDASAFVTSDLFELASLNFGIVNLFI